MFLWPPEANLMRTMRGGLQYFGMGLGFEQPEALERCDNSRLGVRLVG